MVLDHRGIRADVSPAFSAETAAVVQARLGRAIPEMIEAIAQAVPDYASPASRYASPPPEYASPPPECASPPPECASPVAQHASPGRPDYQQRLADAVTSAVACFIARVAQPDHPTEPVLDEFRLIGATAAREGRTLDGLQTALRLGARVAWRWLCEASAALDRRELSRVGEAVFGYLDDLSAACACGYADARIQTEGHRQRQLLRLLLADPPPHPGQLRTEARAAAWPLPTQVAAILLVVHEPESLPHSYLPPHGALSLPPGILADWTAAEPCLLVADPDGPGRRAALDRALLDWASGGRLAVVGPSVPLACAAQSLRWARQARTLAQAGIIPPNRGPIRCDQHLSTLLVLADEHLAAALCDRRLAPLDQLRPAQRDRIAETLLAWLQLGENAAEVAQRIHVHPQTVRYRLRQIHDLFGDQLRDPDRRFDLQLALRLRALTAPKLRRAPKIVEDPRCAEIPVDPTGRPRGGAQRKAGHPQNSTAEAVRG